MFNQRYIITMADGAQDDRTEAIHMAVELTAVTGSIGGSIDVDEVLEADDEGNFPGTEVG